MKSFKISIAGAGSVGLPLALLLAKNNHVTAVDTNIEKVNLINNREYLDKPEIKKIIKKSKLNLSATTDSHTAFKDSDFIIITTSTDFNSETNSLDTHQIEEVLEIVNKVNKHATVIIKSTVPIGYTKTIRQKCNNKNIIFSPEFLREKTAVYDTFYPSRIIIGTDLKDKKLLEASRTFLKILQEGSYKKNIPYLLIDFTEAEAVKLFSNSYLALRISFFNELDTYARIKGLNTENIIQGVCLDSRIGNYYNFPSFGFGGKCLPKDTKQLTADFKDVPQKLIGEIENSNKTRKQYIIESIIKKNPQIVGLYGLLSPDNLNNFWHDSVKEIITILKQNSIQVLIFEPKLNIDNYLDCNIEKDIVRFKEKCDIIISSENPIELMDVKDKIFQKI